MDFLGALAHRGGLVVRRPELSVGIVQAISRSAGLDVEVLTRQPLDRRDATERQRDIRAGQQVQPAPRRLLPDHDEGMHLRVGWLDRPDHAKWVFSTGMEGSSGDHYMGVDGPHARARYELPPTFDTVDLVFAWPEIGFPETVITLPLPDRSTVEQATVSIWHAPVRTLPMPPTVNERDAARNVGRVHIEAGKVLAPPRVLRRSSDAVLVLSRLTEVGSLLSMELVSMARSNLTGWGGTLAVLDGNDIVRLPSGNSENSSGAGTFRSRTEFVTERPAGDVLDLVVAWPEARLPDARVRLSLES